MTDSELLKEAERRFPVGTEFYPVHISDSSKESGNSYTIKQGDIFVWYANHIVIKNKDSNDVYTTKHKNMATVYRKRGEEWTNILNQQVSQTDSKVEEAIKRYPPGTVFCPAHLVYQSVEDTENHTVVQNSHKFEFSGNDIFLKSNLPGTVFNKGDWNPIIYYDATKTWAKIITQSAVTKTEIKPTYEWVLLVTKDNFDAVNHYRIKKGYCKLPRVEIWKYIYSDGSGTDSPKDYGREIFNEEFHKNFIPEFNVKKSFDIRTSDWYVNINKDTLPYINAYRKHKDVTLIMLDINEYNCISKEGYGFKKNNLKASGIFISDYDFINHVIQLTGFRHTDTPPGPRRSAEMSSQRYGKTNPFETDAVQAHLEMLKARPVTYSEAYKGNKNKPQLEDIPVKKRVLL